MFDENVVQDYLKGKLNDEQYKAAINVDCSSLILAGAGSGKTRTLTYKIAYLIFGKGVNPENILAVTFTNKAANEMKERIIELANEIQNEIGNNNSNTNKQIGDSIDDFLDNIEKNDGGKLGIGVNDLKWIGTFHSIFLKILKDDIEKLEMKYNKNFGILDSNDTKSLIKSILKRLNIDQFKPNEVKGFISKQKNNGFLPDDMGIVATSNYENNMLDIYVEYQKELEKSNSLDFDDLLLLPFVLFKKNKTLLQKRINKFDYIMVDEAQDTNRIQFELMKMLSGENGNITLIGDDYQSIYGRRGALMENFLNVKKYWPNIKMFKLQINYRSKPFIVSAGNSIIKNNLNQYEKTIKANRNGNGKIMQFSHHNETDEAGNIIEMLKKMKGTQFTNWKDVAILYRTNSQSSIFEQILVTEGIPYKIYGAFKFFERKEIKDILAYIRYYLNIDDSFSLKRVINIPNRKIGKTTIGNIEEYCIVNNFTLNEIFENINSVPLKITPMAKNGIINFKKVVHEILDNIENLSPSDVIEQTVKKIKYYDFLLKEESGNKDKADERYENIGQLINMSSKYVDKGLDGLRQFMEEVALLSDVDENKTGEIDAVKLMTIHTSKGLEFPHVFIVGLEENIFPLNNATLEPHLLEEERRLMYVAITRAKDSLYFSQAYSRMQRGQTKSNLPSRFIDEIPAELVKHYDLTNSFGVNQEEKQKFDEGDEVKHKLFGTGEVLEIWSNLMIVKFDNPRIGIRKVESRFLEKY